MGQVVPPASGGTGTYDQQTIQCQAEGNYPRQPIHTLGIPMGVDIEDQVEEFWTKIVQKFATIGARWLKYHLSMTGRVMAANTLIMSLPRYANYKISGNTESGEKADRQGVLQAGMGYQD